VDTPTIYTQCYKDAMAASSSGQGILPSDQSLPDTTNPLRQNRFSSSSLLSPRNHLPPSQHGQEPSAFAQAYQTALQYQMALPRLASLPRQTSLPAQNWISNPEWHGDVDKGLPTVGYLAPQSSWGGGQLTSGGGRLMPPYRIASIQGMAVEVCGVKEAAGLSETIGNWGESTVQPEEPRADASPSERITYLDYQLDSLVGATILGSLTVLSRKSSRRHGGQLPLHLPCQHVLRPRPAW
jgi:hypothetical protein